MCNYIVGKYEKDNFQIGSKFTPNVWVFAFNFEVI